jgi:HPt (histidine-containing phosphotransfer) domain-containing protein
MSGDPTAARLAMLRRVGGDKLIHELIDLMLQGTPGKLEAARAALAAGNAAGVGRVAHALTSSAGNLGAIALQEAAYALERCAAGEAGDLAELLRNLERSWESDRARLAEIQRGLSA